MSSLSTMSWVGAAVVSLFAVGCGQPEALETRSTLNANPVSLDRCNDESAFDLAGVIRATGRFPAAMACADFNGDGQVDLATLDPASGTVSVLLNEGNGTLGAPVVFVTGGGSAVVVQDSLDEVSGAGGGSAVVVQDGVGEVSAFGGGSAVVVQDGFANVSAFGGGSAVVVQDGFANVSAFGGGSAVVVQDFNADGWVDLQVTSGSDGTVHILMGHGPGGFAPPVSVSNLAPAQVL